MIKFTLERGHNANASIGITSENAIQVRANTGYRTADHCKPSTARNENRHCVRKEVMGKATAPPFPPILRVRPTGLFKRRETQTIDTIPSQNAQELNIKHTIIDIRMPRVLPVTRLSKSLPDTGIILMLLNIPQVFTSSRETGR
jgi:hypothetical protein